jgi:hypothetical protein
MGWRTGVLFLIEAIIRPFASTPNPGLGPHQPRIEWEPRAVPLR